MPTPEFQKVNLELSPDRQPIFISAGIVKTPELLEQVAKSETVGAVVYGTLTWNRNKVERHGEPDFLYDERSAAAYNKGQFENEGLNNARHYLSEPIKRAQAAGQKVIISGGTLPGENSKETLPNMAYVALELGADGFEVNASCHNLDKALLCENDEEMLETSWAVRKAVGADFYVIYKVAALKETAIQAFCAGGLAADGVSAVNALGYPLEQITTLRARAAEVIDEKYRGYSQSGRIIANLSLQNLQMWQKAGAGRYDIWSVGGAELATDVFHRLQLGAYAVGFAQLLRREADIVQAIDRIGQQYQQIAANRPTQLQIFDKGEKKRLRKEKEEAERRKRKRAASQEDLDT